MWACSLRAGKGPGCDEAVARDDRGPLARSLVVVLLEALLAHVVLFEFRFAEDLGDMHRGRVGTAFAFVHGKIPGANV